MKLPLSAVLVLAVYVVAITAFGTWLGRRGRSVKDYFLGGRSVPWWAIAACIVATETSTLTFIGAPGTAYNGNWTFLQLVLGYVIGRLVVAWLFIPAYFRGRLLHVVRAAAAPLRGRRARDLGRHLPHVPDPRRRDTPACRRAGAVGRRRHRRVVVTSCWARP